MMGTRCRDSDYSSTVGRSVGPSVDGSPTPTPRRGAAFSRDDRYGHGDGDDDIDDACSNPRLEGLRITERETVTFLHLHSINELTCDDDGDGSGSGSDDNNDRESTVASRMEYKLHASVLVAGSRSKTIHPAARIVTKLGGLT